MPPISTIAFALASCATFGLAIRDTMTDKHGHRRAILDDDELATRRELERVGAPEVDGAAELEADRQEADRRMSERSQMLDRVFGAEVATLGVAFDGAVLGGPVDAVDPRVRERLERVGVAVSLDSSVDHTVYAIGVSARGVQQECETFTSHLVEAWGVSQVARAGRVWLNPANAQRSVLRDCELRFEAYRPVATWLDRSQRSVVPMWAVGQPASKLRAKLQRGEGVLQVLDGSSPEHLVWTAVGVGIGAGPTKLDALVRNGTITGLTASVAIGAATQDEIIARISELTGKKPDDTLLWKSNPPIAIEEGPLETFVSIGKTED